MQEAFFHNIESRIVQSVRSAKRNIKIAMAWFTNSNLFDELIQAMHRGVKVELILLDDVINWQPYAPDFNKINYHENGQVRIAYRSSGFMHHKFCIIDTELLITGSYNWTYYAEKRNIENVVVSDDQRLIAAYIDEFERLRMLNNESKECPRYTREEIEQMESVDFVMLNTETELATKAQHLSYCPIYETHTMVKVVQKKHNPVAAFNIGVSAVDSECNEVLGVIIPRGQSLPCTLSVEFYAYRDERDILSCDILYGTSKDANANKRLKTRSIKEITEGCSAKEFTIQIEITLNTNGYLLAEICCRETQKAIQLIATNSELVNYEKE